MGMEAVHDWDSFSYLGAPIFKKGAKAIHWTPIIDKMKKRIQNWGTNWLNPAGKTILLKSVLMSMPVYQTSILLAPTSILKKMESLIKKFLWEGGKGNTHRLHLVSWNKIQKPYKEGGLQVRDLANQNLAMGAKILWRLIAGKESWCSKVLRKKYFSGERLRCLDRPILRKSGSSIYKLCLKALPSFKPNLYWIPGNGKKINLWEDAIMGDQPLNHNPGIKNIMDWAQNNNVNTLWDISN